MHRAYRADTPIPPPPPPPIRLLLLHSALAEAAVPGGMGVHGGPLPRGRPKSVPEADGCQRMDDGLSKDGFRVFIAEYSKYLKQLVW